MSTSKAWLLALTLGLSCGGDKAPTDSAGGPDGDADADADADADTDTEPGETGTSLAPVVFSDPSSEVSAEKTTVVTVRFTTDRPVRAQVKFGEAGATDRLTPLPEEAKTEHEILLLGLPADTEITWLPVQGDQEGEAQRVTTGSLPAGVPVPELSGPRGSFLLTTATGGDNWVLLVDGQGRVVWWARDDRGLSVFRARVLRDGSGVVYASAIVKGGPAPDSVLVKVPWAGGPEEVIAVPDLAHDFLETEDGLFALTYAERDGVLGNALERIDDDGTRTVLWDSWRCFDPIATPGDDPAQGWTHANALDWDAAAGTFLVGLRNFNAITEVDPTTGDCLQTIGRIAATVPISGSPFLHQHQFERVGDRLLVFDNDGAPGLVSRGIEYQLTGSEAVFVREFVTEPTMFSFIMGDILRTEGDNTLVLFSVPRTLVEFNGAGEEIWRMTMGGAGPLGFFSQLPSPYEPG